MIRTSVREESLSISGPEELEGMRAVGAVVRRVIEAMRKSVRPGVTTAELDAIGDKVMRDEGARYDPAVARLAYGLAFDLFARNL